MTATLGDPVLLATFSLPSSTRKGKGKEVAVDERPFVFASFSTVPKREDEQVMLAVQGDGLLVYELGDLHPVSSRTLGPSTSFASASATIICSDSQDIIRRTYVAVNSSQDVKGEACGRVIWAWKEPVSGDITTSQDRQSVKLDHEIAYLVVPQDSNSVIAVSNTGSLTWMDLDLNTKNSWSPKVEAQRIKKLFTFPTSSCGFLPAGVLSGHTLVLFVERDEKLFMQTVLLGAEGEMTILDTVDVPLGDIDSVVDISLDPSGNLSILGSNGTWTPFFLRQKDSSISISPGSSSLHLKALSFISAKERKAPSVSLFSLGSCFVLLAGTTAKEIALLLWDIQYGVLLQSTTLPIPSNLDASTNGVSVQLAKGTGSQALLILSPRTAISKRSGELRSSVLVVPFSVPERSTVANAMGKAGQGAAWLAAGPVKSARQEEDVHGRETMLSSLQEALANGRVKQAEEVFFIWVKEWDEKIKYGKSSRPADNKGANTPQDVEMTDGEAQKTKDAKKSPPLRSVLEHAFVTRLLSTVLHPDEPPNKHYSPKICRYIVTKHLVSHSMVKGGLLDALAQRYDWETIRECFIAVVDLPENELLRLLHVVVMCHRERSVVDKDAAAVDKPEKKKPRADGPWDGIPSVRSMLSRIVDYPATQVLWRTALREHFADVENLISLLNIADEWIDAYTIKDLLPIGFGEVKLNEHGIPVPVQSKSSKPLRHKGVSLPTLENLLSFVQAILDSSFVNLLQSPESPPLFQRISDNIALIQSENLELHSLRGPLEPFARAQAKAVADAASVGKKHEEVDWRKRRKQAHEQAALSLGPYQVEELVF